MKKILLALLFFFAVPAFAGPREIINPDLNGDIKVIVNKAGTPTTVMQITGSTGAIQLGEAGGSQAFTFNNNTLTLDSQGQAILNLDAAGTGVARVQFRQDGVNDWLIGHGSTAAEPDFFFNNPTGNDVGLITKAGGWTWGPAGGQSHLARISDGGNFTVNGLYTASSTSNHFLKVQRDGGAVAGVVGYNDSPIAIYVGTITNHPLHFRTNNTLQATLDTSGNFTMSTGDLRPATGSSGNPSLSWSGDTDTGMWNSASGETTFVANGDNVVTIGPTALTVGTGKNLVMNSGDVTADNILGTQTVGSNYVRVGADVFLRRASAANGTACDTACNGLSGGSICIAAIQISTAGTASSCATTLNSRRCLCMNETD